MTQTPPSAAKPGHGWMKWALIASLVVNVLIAGLVIGAVSQGRPDARSSGGGGGTDFRGPPEIAALVRGLDRAQRRDLFAAMRGTPGLRDGRGRIRRAQEDILTALEADPFDPAAFEAALTSRRQTQDEVARAGITVFTGFIAEMSPEARIDLAAQTRDRIGRRTPRN